MEEQPTQPRTMTEARRLVGIFWEPRPAFEDLAQRPRFWVPLLLLTVLAIVFMLTFSRVVGWETLLGQQLASNPRLDQLTPQQRQQALTTMARVYGTAVPVVAAVGPVAMMLVVSAVLLGCFNLLGGAGVKFRQAFSVTCYSSLPNALATIGALVVMLLKNPEDFSLQNPLPLNLGAFLTPSSTSRWLMSLATSIDLFSFWVILLLAAGFSAAAKQNKTKMSYGQALALVLIPWAVYVVLKCGLAAIGGSFGAS